MDLADLADIDPGAGDAGYGRARAVFFQAQHPGVEIHGLFELSRVIVDAIARMMELDDLDRHGFLLVMPAAAPSFPWAAPRNGRRSPRAARTTPCPSAGDWRCA